MSPAEWFDFMAESEEQVFEQIKAHLPDVEFTSIRAGLPPIVYLQQRRGMAEVTAHAVKLELDNEGNITRVEILTPSQ